MKLLLLLLTVLLLACSSQNSVAGGTTSVGNGFVIASVTFKGNPVSVKVQLVPADHEPDSEISSDIIESVSNVEGVVSFENIQQGNYSLVVIDTVEQYGSIKKDITPSSDTEYLNHITLEKLGTVAYYLPDSLSAEKISVSVKGTLVCYETDLFIQYENEVKQVLFHNVPAGDFLISTIEMNDSTRLTVDTLSVYAAETTAVTYEDIVIDSIRPIWEFPLIVGVTSDIIYKYGNLQTVKILIEDHVFRAETAFRQEYFKGSISFTVDSVYVIKGRLDEENTLPPEGFAYRLLYSPYQKSPFGGWVTSNRVMVHDYSEMDQGGTFGYGSLFGLRWLMGMSRGAYYLTQEKVYAMYNTVSDTAYTPQKSVMTLESPDIWADYNIELINRNGSYKENVNITQFRSAESLEITIVDSAGIPLEGAYVEIYGTRPFSYKVTEPALSSILSNSSGKIILETPYLSTDRANIINSNMLLKINFQGTIQYNWLPYSEVSLSCIQTDSDTFYKQITF